MSLPMFFYGTLRDSAIREAVFGEDAGLAEVRPARLEGHEARLVAGEDYPQLRPAPGAVTEGVVVSGLTARARARIAFFEGSGEYRVETAEVRTAAGPVRAEIWADAGLGRPLAGPWDFARWQREAQPAFLEATREYMDHMGRLPEDGFDIWHGIRLRAAARLNAAGERPVCRLRAPFGPADTERLGLARPYARFFGVEDHAVRFRRFDGGLSRPVTRSVLASGDAVTVLPWDPATDRVLLVEQWRAGPFARGDACPWTLEAVAGRRDGAEAAEATARREALEEAGIALGRLARVAAYYPSPGILAEHITSFVGEARLAEAAAAGGSFGLAEEEEDIRLHVLPLAEALAASASGEINNAPLLLTLFWLARERDRLRAEWARPAVLEAPGAAD